MFFRIQLRLARLNLELSKPAYSRYVYEVIENSKVIYATLEVIVMRSCYSIRL